jgi:hypothetical protein
MVVDHEFGAQHTELKLSVVESYLKAFTTALRPHMAPSLSDQFQPHGLRLLIVRVLANFITNDIAGT